MTTILDYHLPRETAFTYRLLAAAARSAFRLAAAAHRIVINEIDRRQTMALMAWDARDLADIGVSRGDVAGALLSAPDARPSDSLAQRRRDAWQNAEAQKAEMRSALR